MSNTIEDFKRAVALFDSVVADVPADAWGNTTPCEAWDATELVRHQCGVLDALADIARTGEINMPRWPARLMIPPPGGLRPGTGSPKRSTAPTWPPKASTGSAP
ncbi:maleylpyruvate isomerase N-terminal domain-containing protein [Candidatus Poriferisodalis sp.]|uniref:maleylpyruvate isomerase N-terminal domain-containing protein n=1 Tax=Candidatus Poriferisodalis sp. TaxID=3101277 RepID=UPI003B025B70